MEQDRTTSSIHSKRQRRELDWRMDPVESRSDFTIEISIAAARRVQDANTSSAPEEEKVVDTYHVHKILLEFGGTKSSGYFAGLFASATAESQSNKTRISLHKLAADAFPVLLDHLYSLDGGVPELTIQNAAPVHHLADYLEVDSLCSKVLQFWENGIEIEDLGMCLDHASTFRIDALLVVRKCSDKITQIELDSHLMEVADAEFWLAVRVEMESKRGIRPCFLALIAEFCFVRKDHLDAETFAKLTASATRTMMRMQLAAAVKLLEVEQAVLPSAKEPTHLQTLCVDALASDWKNSMKSTNQQKYLQMLSPLLVSKLMSASFEHAQEEIQVLRALHGKPLHSHPTSISVTGAGTSAVNGVYSRAAPFDIGDPEYTMNGEWEGQPTTFSLALCPTNPTQKLFWYISIEREDVIFFYTAIPFADKLICKLPRQTGWLKYVSGDSHVSGDSPGPTLTYSFD